jgi:mannobiose 2-epimerase
MFMKTSVFKIRKGKTMLCLIAIVLCNQNMQTHAQKSGGDDLSAKLDYSLQNYILKQWYPRCLDTIEGGYFTEFKSDWKKSEDQPKMIVTQSRLIWTSAQAAMFYHDTSYVKYARHGVRFLKDKMWDKTYGGFYSFYPKKGAQNPYGNDNSKQGYGNAFAIYGLSAYYRVTLDTSALNLAKRCFYWLEKHSHDSVYGGYIDRLTQEGNWFKSSGGPAAADPYVVKDYNSSIHLLEAFTSLYEVWPDPLVKERLSEMLRIVRDTIVGNKGYEGLFFSPQWKRFTNQAANEETIRKNSFMDHISFGHDVETAFLMLEASHTLNIKNDTLTLRIARKMVDQSLAHGFDKNVGGFYDEGYYFDKKNEWVVLSKNAQWWVQAEGLNALLLMSKIFPENPDYYAAFLKQWDFINQYLIDKTNGEWYFNALNTNPDAKDANKGTIWKVNYHNGRALMNCIHTLKDENEVAREFYTLAHNK